MCGGGRITARNLIHKQMSNLKERLVEEQAQLEEKLMKLDAFRMSKKFDEIDDVQKALLNVQSAAMNTYNQCLKERLERL